MTDKQPQPALLERAKNPAWEHYMKVVFPTMMSYVPGGINYDMTVTLERRVINWIHQHDLVRSTCLAVKCGINGGMEFPITTSWDEQWDRIRDMSVSGNLRKYRRKWKRTMDILGWNCSDDLWRRPEDGRDNAIWGDEWKAFHGEILKIHPLPKERANA